MADWTIPADVPEAVRAWWEVLRAQLTESGRIATAQPIHVRMLAQALFQYEWITEEINTRGSQVDVLFGESCEKRQVAPEVLAQAKLQDQIRTLLKDLELDEVAGEDPIASLKRRLLERTGGTPTQLAN